MLVKLNTIVLNINKRIGLSKKRIVYQLEINTVAICRRTVQVWLANETKDHRFCELQVTVVDKMPGMHLNMSRPKSKYENMKNSVSFTYFPMSPLFVSPSPPTHHPLENRTKTIPRGIIQYSRRLVKTLPEAHELHYRRPRFGEGENICASRQNGSS